MTNRKGPDMTDDRNPLTLIQHELEMGEYHLAVLDRMIRIKEQLASAAVTGCVCWVPDDEPPVAETADAVAAFEAFPVTEWWAPA